MILSWEVCEECGGDLPPRGRCSYCAEDLKRAKAKSIRFTEFDDEAGDALD